MLALSCGGEPATADASGRDAGIRDAGPRRCARAADCDDGICCDGAESCVDALCVAGEPPCDGAIAICKEDVDRCTLVECIEELADRDGDGHDSIICGGQDCDDADPDRYPGNTELCDPDGYDEDCDPTTFGFRDQDIDCAPDAACCNGTICGTDCDDLRADVHLGAPRCATASTTTAMAASTRTDH